MHLYLDDNPTGAASDSYTIGVTLTDDDTGEATASTTVTVNNLDPVIVSVNAPVIDENGTATVTGSFTDVGTLDTHTAVIDWGDGTTSNATIDPVARTFSADHQYLDDNPTGTGSDSYTIGVRLTDDDTGVGSASAQITVNNLSPHNVEIDQTVQTYVFAVGAPMPFTGSFADVGTADTHSAAWTFSHVGANGVATETRPGTVSEALGNGSVSNSFSFTEAGVYTVTLTVTDDDTGATTSESRTFVVYDTSAGFVTGGGWIDSPAGAYMADPALTGKATFGFVSQYKKGATRPTGQTEFQFKAGDLNFHSSAYDWLVVAGARAQYKGTGTINGQGEFGFMLTAIDGQISGGGGTDTFRIKIWDKANDAVVYDNQLGASDDDAPTTALRGGSVVIHKGGSGLAATAAPLGTSTALLSQPMLDLAVNQAIAGWVAAGVDPRRLQALGAIDVQIAQLRGPTLGLWSSSTDKIWLDLDAAGRGWSPDDGGYDLVSAVSHELGHALGLSHRVLGESLAPGEVRLPSNPQNEHRLAKALAFDTHAAFFASLDDAG